MADAEERLGILENRMDRVEEGVANFRSFQVDARDFFSRADERAKEEERHRNTRDQEIKEALEASNNRINQSIAHRGTWWTIAGVMVTIMGLFVSVAALWTMIYLAKHSEVEPMDMMHNHHAAVYASDSATEVQIPHMR